MRRSMTPKILALIFGLLTGLAQADVAAIVNDQVGQARYQVGGDWKSIGLLTSLPSGTVLELSPQAKTSLSFVSGGRQAHLTGPCRVTIKADGVVPQKGSPTQVRLEQAPKLVGKFLPQSVNFDQMAGLVRVESQVSASIISDSVVRSETAILCWKFAGQADGFVVVVLETESENEVFRQSVPANLRELALENLQADSEYTVLLQTEAGQDQFETRFPIVVLSAEELDAITRQEQLAQAALEKQPGDLSPKVALLSFYINQQLWSDALKLSRDLIQQRPEDSNLKMIEQLLGERE
jgi:hypothetical protein